MKRCEQFSRVKVTCSGNSSAIKKPQQRLSKVSQRLNEPSSLTNYAGNYSTKGEALYDPKRDEEALAAFDHALQRNPRDQNAHRGKIHTLLRLKRKTELLPAMKQSLYWWMH